MTLILSKTPFRMSFVGGGSDLQSYYKKKGGAVLSTTINKFMYIAAKYSFENEFILHYSKTEKVNNINKIQHPLIRETLKELKISAPMQISSLADIPGSGTGLGSSSSFVVGLANAVSSLNQKNMTNNDLAEFACKIEIDKCNEPIGKQDQFAASFGGFNVIEFNPDNSVSVIPLNINKDLKSIVEKNIQVFYTNKTRSTSSILNEQKENMKNSTKIKLMNRMVELVYILKKDLESGNHDSFGEILSENWSLKKQLSQGVSNSYIEELNEKAISSGAFGTKRLGGGGGGFFMTYSPQDCHHKISSSLSKLNEYDFKFEANGSQIVYN